MFPIETTYQTGLTLYAVIHHPDGRVANNTLMVWETFNPSNWADYDVPLPEQGTTGYYRGAYPSWIAGVLTTEAVYIQGGGTPANNDTSTGLAQTQGANMAAIGGSVAAALNMALSGAQLVAGAAEAGTLSTTQATTDLTHTLLNAYQGRTILWTSGALAGVAAGITGYAVAGGLLTFTPVPVAPSAADTFIIV